MCIHVYTHARGSIGITEIEIASTTSKAGLLTYNIYASKYVCVHTHRRDNVAIHTDHGYHTKGGTYNVYVSVYVYICIHTQTWQRRHHRDTDREYHSKGGTVDVLCLCENIFICICTLTETWQRSHHRDTEGPLTYNVYASIYIYVCIHTQTCQYSYHRDSDREYHTKGGTVDVQCLCEHCCYIELFRPLRQTGECVCVRMHVRMHASL